MNALSQFTEFLLSKGYQLIEDNQPFKTTTYELDSLFIKIVQDRNLERFISLSRTNNHSWEGWYDMDIIRFLIIKAPYEEDNVFRFEPLSQFLIDNYEDIIGAFSPLNFLKTELALTDLQNERAKVLFGYDG